MHNKIKARISLSLVAMLLLSIMTVFPIITVNASPTTYFSVINPENETPYFNYTDTEPPPTDTNYPLGYLIANITVTDVNQLKAWQINVTWNPTLLEIAEPADLYLPSDHIFSYPGAILSPFPKNIDNTKGTVFWGASLAPGSDPGHFNGSGVCARIKFNVTRAPLEGETLSCNISHVTTGAFVSALITAGGVKMPYTPHNGYYEYAYTPGELHDVAVNNVILSETKAYEGTIININVTVENEGTVSETFNVTTYYDGNAIQTQTDITLNPDIKTTLTFSWNTTGNPGNHRISAEASIVHGETDTSDNILVNGVVEIVARTDISIKEGENGTIEGNITITNALVTKNTLQFNASGPPGSIGWVNVTFPMINTSNIKVFINKVKLTPPPFPIITTNGTYYFIYFELNLSTHEITIQYAIADIAITNAALSKTVVGQGYPMNVTATVENRGDFDETFNFTIYFNDTNINLPNGENYTTITLTSGNYTTVTIPWNTTGVARGNYTITAEATIVQGETDTTDNTFTDGWVFVTILGDVNGDRVVDGSDVIIIIEVIPSYPSHPMWNPNCDLNNDGVVDGSDLVIVIEHTPSQW